MWTFTKSVFLSSVTSSRSVHFPRSSLKKSLKSVAVALAVSLMVACGNESPESDPQPVRPVKMITVASGESLQKHRFPAVIDAVISSDLHFPVGGRVQKLLITEAQKVKQGELLALLEPQDYISRVNSAKAQYEAAEQEYQRALRLIKQEAIAQREFEQRAAQRDSAKATFETAQKALQDTELKAPYAGIISRVPVKALQNVQPGTTVVSMIATNRWKATINVPAQFIATAPLRQYGESNITLSALPERPIPATYQEATLEADAASQTYAITFSFDAPENVLILPGMSAYVTMESSARLTDEDQVDVIVPLAAILSDGSQQYVWVVDPADMTVQKREVEVQPGVGHTLVITDGLAAGESIVAAGATYLSEGMQVRRWNE